MQNGKDLSQYPDHTKNSFWWKVLFWMMIKKVKDKIESCGLLKMMKRKKTQNTTKKFLLVFEDKKLLLHWFYNLFDLGLKL